MNIITRSKIYNNFRTFYQRKVFSLLVGECFFDPELKESTSDLYMRLQNHIKKRGLIDVLTFNILIFLEHGPDFLLAGFSLLMDICDKYLEKYTRVYNVCLKLTDSVENLDMKVLGEKSHLIKAGNDYYIWGYKEKEWQLSPIALLDINFDWPESQVLSISAKDNFYNTFKKNHTIPTKSWLDFIMIFLLSPIMIILALLWTVIPVIPRLLRPLLGFVGSLLAIPFVNVYAYFEYRRCLKTIRCAELKQFEPGLFGEALDIIENVLEDPINSIKLIEKSEIFELTNKEVITLRTYPLYDILQQKKHLEVLSNRPNQEWLICAGSVYCIPFLTQEFQQYRSFIFGNTYTSYDVLSVKEWNKPCAILGQQTLMLICILQQRRGAPLFLAGHILDYLIDANFSDIKLKDMGFPCITKNAHLFFARKALTFYTTRKAANDRNETELAAKSMLQTSNVYINQNLDEVKNNHSFL